MKIQIKLCFLFCMGILAMSIGNQSHANLLDPGGLIDTTVTNIKYTTESELTYIDCGGGYVDSTTSNIESMIGETGYVTNTANRDLFQFNEAFSIQETYTGIHIFTGSNTIRWVTDVCQGAERSVEKGDTWEGSYNVKSISGAPVALLFWHEKFHLETYSMTNGDPAVYTAAEDPRVYDIDTYDWNGTSLSSDVRQPYELGWTRGPYVIKVKSRTLPYGTGSCVGLYEISNILSAWPGEQFNVTIAYNQLNDCHDWPFPNLPANGIVWEVDGHDNPPNNTVENYFTWYEPDLYAVQIQIGVIERAVVVDVPDVGDLSRLEFAAVQPLIAASVTSLAIIAQNWADNLSYPIEQRDAIRHAYWASLIATEWTPNIAIQATTAHEYDNKVDDERPAYESTIDLHNNILGAQEVHTIPVDPGTLPDIPTIRQEILSLVDSGALWMAAGELDRQIVKTNGEKIIP